MKFRKNQDLVHLFIDIPLFLFCAFLLWKAFRYSLSDNYRPQISLGLILFTALILRIYVASDLYIHEWDERYHALVAKNMIQTPLKPMLYENPVLSYNFQNWTANHIWLHKPPLPLWALALSMNVFGVHEFALRLPTLLVSLASVFLTFKIGRLFFGSKAGLLAAALHAIHGLHLEMTGGRVTTDHYDIFFCFFIELGIYLSFLFAKEHQWKYGFLAGLAVGGALLTKWLPGLIVLPVFFFLYLHYHKKKWMAAGWKSIFIILTAALLAMPWQFYIHSAFPKEAAWESAYNWKHFTEPLEGHQHSPLFFFKVIRLIFGEFIYIPLLFLAWRGLKKPSYLYGALGVWIALPVLVFSIAQTKMQGYILFIGPALFILTAWFVRHLWRYRKKIKYKLAYIISIGLFLLPVRYSIERSKIFQARERQPGWKKEMVENLAGSPHTRLLHA